MEFKDFSRLCEPCQISSSGLDQGLQVQNGGSFIYQMEKKLTCLTSGHSTCCFKLSRSSDSAPFRMSAPLNCRFSVSSSLTRASAFSHFCFVKSTLNSICFSFCKALFSSSCVTARVLCELYRFSMSRISCLISSTFLLATSSRCSRTSFSLFNSVHCDSSSET